MLCATCGKKLEAYQNSYCSNVCQHNKQYLNYINDWKQGKKDGNRGKQTILISKHLKRYLFEKYKHRCCRCGWSARHPTTGQVPLEINHIDGNARNNYEANLELLCPNCHALTDNFRNLNKGNGRTWRRKSN
jgi:predicted restriction endonuclease